MSRDRVIINRDATIGGDEITSFGEHQRIDLERTSFNTARSGK